MKKMWSFSCLIEEMEPFHSKLLKYISERLRFFIKYVILKQTYNSVK